MKEEVEQILQAKGARGGAPRAGSRPAPGKPAPAVTGTPTRGSAAPARRTGVSAQKTVTPTQGAKKARSGPTDENGHPDVGNKGPATLRPATLTTTLAKVTMTPVLGPVVLEVPLSSPQFVDRVGVPTVLDPILTPWLLCAAPQNLMDLDVNSPKTESAAAAPKSFKRELQIDVNAENMEPPTKQATPTPTSDAPKGSSFRAPGKSMLKQPTSFRGQLS